MATDNRGVDPRFDPAFQRGYTLDPELPVGEAALSTVPSLRGNPWVVVLWILSTGMVAAGIWALWQAQAMLEDQDGDSLASNYVYPGILYGVSPWLIAVGLASLVATVFLYAVRWRRA